MAIAFPEAINEGGRMVGGHDNEALVWRIPVGCKPDAYVSYVRCAKETALQSPTWSPDWVWASAINDDGTIVGVASDYDGTRRWALLWSPSGKLRVLAPLRAGGSAEASDVNNRGQIVGWSGGRPVLWEQGKPRALPGGPGKAHAINDRGVIVGVVGGQAVLWEQGRLRKLATPSGKLSKAVDINGGGQIVGRVQPKSGAWYAALWEKGKMLNLGTGMVPEAINNRGQIVGSCRKQACIWQSGQLTMLTEDADRARAVDINDRRQILGLVEHSQFNEGHDVYLWTYEP